MQFPFEHDNSHSSIQHSQQVHHIHQNQLSFEGEDHIPINQINMANHPKQMEVVIQHHDTAFKHIQKMCKIFRRIHSRKFIIELKSWLISSLFKDNQSQLRYQDKRTQFEVQVQTLQLEQWSLKKLFMKKKKTIDEELTCQFLEICATRIQSYFKMYIVQKRHKHALKKVNYIKNTLVGLLKGWKTRKIISCQKIVEIKKQIFTSQNQINREIEFSSLPKELKIKKINYLSAEHEKLVLLYSQQFNHLYSSGAWIFSMNPLNKKISQKRKENKFVHVKPTHEYEPIEIKISSEENNTESKISQRNYLKKNQIKANNKKQNQLSESNIDNKVQILSINNNFMEDRPIKAKGSYLIDEENSNYINQNKKQKQIKNLGLQAQQKERIKTQSNNQIEDQQKIVQKIKLVKRQKYDPRKAIEDEKKKKKQIKVLDIEIQQKQKIVVKTQIKEVAVDKSQKIDQKNSVKTNPTTKIMNLNEEKKNKVGSKIDCWGIKKSNNKRYEKHFEKQVGNENAENKPDKTSEINSLNRIQSSYSFKHEQRTQKHFNKNQQTAIDVEEEAKKMQEQLLRRQKHEFQEQQKQKKIIHMKRLQREFERQKQEQKYANYMKSHEQASRPWKYEQLQNNIKEIKQKVNENIRKQVYRPIEQLESAYQIQYVSRYQNLMPKLGLIQATRSAKHQLSNSIPVIGSNSKWVDTIMKETQPSAFWQLASQMEKKFKQFVYSI